MTSRPIGALSSALLVVALGAAPVNGQNTPSRAASQPSSTARTSPESAPSDGADLPVSLERVRQGLERNPAIDLAIATAITGGQAGRPIFRVRSEGRLDLDKAFKLAHPPMPPPPTPMGIDLLAFIRGGVSNAMRAYRERQARAAYTKAMQDYCSAFPELTRTLPACLQLSSEPVER